MRCRSERIMRVHGLLLLVFGNFEPEGGWTENDGVNDAIARDFAMRPGNVAVVKSGMRAQVKWCVRDRYQIELFLPEGA
jgi:hypothetical protein